VNRRDVLIEDEIEARKAGDMWWFLHTAATVHTNGAMAELQLNGKKMFARILSPANAKFELMKAEPLPNSAHPPVQAKNDGVSKLVVHLPDMARVRVVVLLSPEPNQRTDVLPLDRW